MSFNLAKLQIEASMPLENIKDSLGKAYKAEHRDAFYAAQREAYDVLFPVTREVDAVSTDGLPLYMDVDGHCTTEQIGDRCKTTENIDYSEDLTFKTYAEYRDETIITQNYIKATYDIDGITILTPEVREVTEAVRPYVPQFQSDVDALVNSNKELVEYQAKVAKVDLLETLDTMVVTTSTGKTFNADSTSRVNMMSAVISSEFLGVITTDWKLADNTVVLVTLTELKEATMLALVKFGQLKGIIA
jgi:hypothetical protein